MALIVRISLEKGWERLIFWNDNSLYCCRLCGHTIQQAGWDCSVELGTTSIGGLGTGFPNVAVLQASWSWTLFLNKLQCLINYRSGQLAAMSCQMSRDVRYVMLGDLLVPQILHWIWGNSPTRKCQERHGPSVHLEEARGFENVEK